MNLGPMEKQFSSSKTSFPLPLRLLLPTEKEATGAAFGSPLPADCRFPPPFLFEFSFDYQVENSFEDYLSILTE
ncbi:hypothetical protein MLD38_030254 [Melastoma candidum]|uniref:Uncharacterized protein n=1 Tax=Melastoma candidum TaxID=119954 RepID=A0ACB9MRD4_9MYRT|nr:hypothetical protein MLD38_030254 [Melastoma candidum]